MSTRREKRNNMQHESNVKTAKSGPSLQDNFLRRGRGIMDGRGQYGRGKDDHGNDDDHDEDHIDDQDNAAFVRPYGGYGDGTYWHGLGNDHGRGGGCGGYDNDCRTRENWRLSANGEVCRSRLYRTKWYPELEGGGSCCKISDDAHISNSCLFQKAQ